VLAAAEAGTGPAPTTSVGSVSNRSMARLLGGAGAVGAQATAPAVLSRLAQQAHAPEGESEEEPAPLIVAEEFQPEPGHGMTEDGLGVQQVRDEEPVPAGPAAAAPGAGFVDLGRRGTRAVGSGHRHGDVPQAFIPTGRTGSVAWAGGGGAGPHGNEAVGSIQLSIPPVYQSQSNGLFSDSEAWVMPGTGLLMAWRSFVGSSSGDQGNGWWVTPAAVTKLDQHEQLHVTMTQNAYNAYLAPVEAKMTDRRTAYSQSGAIDALKAHIGWQEAITNFQTWDDLYNFPMKAVDTVDLASGTYVVDSGPGTVAGTAFAHRLRIPSEGNPAP